MLRTAFFITVLLAPLLAHGASPTANLSVSVVPATSAGSGNCPSTPPPAAQRAGYTSLIYCLDGGDPANATLSNWLVCPGSDSLAVMINNSGPCDSAHYFQAADPATGKTVIQYHQNYANDGTTMSENQMVDPNCPALPNNCAGQPYGGTRMNIPANSYREVRFRVSTYGGSSGQTAPDFWSWNLEYLYIPNATLGEQPMEKDTIEGGAGTGDSQGNIDWSACDCGISAFAGPSEIQSYINGWAMQDQHSYGELVTGDGVQYQQFCGYVDNTLIATNNPSSYQANCNTYCYLSSCSWSGADETHHLFQHDILSMWTGGATNDQDTYIEYFAVWACPDPNTNNCNNGLVQ